MDRRRRLPSIAAATIALVAVAVAGDPAGAAGSLAIPVNRPATVTRPARRDVSFAPGAVCDMATVQLLAGRHPGVRQFVIAAGDSWSTTVVSLQVVARSVSGDWRCQMAPVTARVGKNGMRPLAERRSGDGTTPAGAFPLGSVRAWDGEQFQFFGNQPDPGVRGHYRNVRQQDCWGATPNDPSYQKLVDAPGCTSPDEWLTSIGDVYSNAAVIGANLDPISGDAPGEPALAAAIFLHRNAYTASGASKPTSGCVSLAQDDLVVALQLIDPALGVQFAIGELSWLRETA
jgi:L,D-peptidoglycan transpeptidase YkuD (ErfK/YbiS/YcfS/YnhG family)